MPGIVSVKTDLSYGKRSPFIWQKMTISIGVPEVYVSVKRDLFIWEKRPIYMAKEAC
jgi:hypothetical protein